MARPPLRTRTEDSADGYPIKGTRPPRGLALQLFSSAPRLRPSLFFSPTHRNRRDHFPVALHTGEAGRSSARLSHDSDLRLPGRAEGCLRPPEARPCRARGKLQKTLDSGRTLFPCMVSLDGSFDGFACAMVLLVRWFCLCDGFPLLWFSSFSSD
jgi:hypothetical protein